MSAESSPPTARCPGATARFTGELVLATLWLAPTPARERALADAAAAPGVDWDAALVALEAHGVLGLALRNLERAGALPEETVHLRLRARAEVMRALDVGFRLTLERFLQAAARRGVEPTLLKGASLAQDLYPEGGLRAQGDLDLLVEPADVPAALAAAREIGLDLPPRAFPAWWHRLAHFHLKLAPSDPLQRELELHWHLHPEAALLTVRLAELRARRVPIDVAGVRASTLDPLDRLLHLATHLARHAHPAPGAGFDRAALVAIAEQPTHPLRLKWLLDLHAELEARHAALDADALVERASAWNAVDALARVLDAVLLLGCVPDAAAWIARVRGALPASTRASAPADAHGPSARPLRGLDLRASSLAAFPRWVWPPASVLAVSSGSAGPAARLGHAARVLGRAALVAAATPAAWLAGRLRRRGVSAALDPATVMELVASARRIQRADGAAPRP